MGAGSGVSFAYYPQSVTELLAVEPEPNLRVLALEAAHGSDGAMLMGPPMRYRRCSGRAGAMIVAASAGPRSPSTWHRS